MIALLTRRLAAAVVVLLAVITVCFFLLRALPRGPFDDANMVDPVIRQNILATYDLDAPLHEQYLRYMGQVVLEGDLGPSLSHRDFTVSEILAESLPISAVLGVAALLVALVVGLGAGALAASRAGSAWDTALMTVASLGLALPNFVVAGLLILAFVFLLPWFPVAGAGRPSQLVLPALALGLPFAASVARLFRTGLLEVLGEDWIRTARAKGLTPRAVVTVHALRPALLPVVSFLGPTVAGILSGSLVVERVFAIPGMGRHFVDSAFHADYNLALGAVIVYAVLVSLCNLGVDVVYALLDPRIEAA